MTLQRTFSAQFTGCIPVTMDVIVFCVTVYTSLSLFACSAKRTVSFGIKFIPVMFGLMRDTTRLVGAIFRTLVISTFGMNTSDSMVQVDGLFEQIQQQLQLLHLEIVNTIEGERVSLAHTRPGCHSSSPAFTAVASSVSFQLQLSGIIYDR